MLSTLYYVASLLTFYYLSWWTHYINLLTVRSLSLQADSVLPLPAREINERKQTITRELQLSFAVKSVVRVSLFCSLDSSEASTKNNKGNLRKVLCLLVCTRFASRAYAWKKIKVVTPALLEREREREREYKNIWNYQIICCIFSVFLR